MEKRLSFLFYLNWEEQVDDMTDEELRRFIKNLCRFSREEEVELPTKVERMCWRGILPALESNKVKYDRKVLSNRENGKLGGAPPGNQNARKEEIPQIDPIGSSENHKTIQTNQTTQNNPNNLIIDNSKKTNDNSKMVKENRQELNENREEENSNSKLENENWEVRIGNGEKIIDLETEIPEQEPNQYNYNSLENTNEKLVDKQREQEQFCEETYQNWKRQQKEIEDKQAKQSLRVVIGKLMKNYYRWEKDLSDSKLDEFIASTTEYHQNDPELIGIITKFSEL